MPKLKTKNPRASSAKQLLAVEDLTAGVDLRRSPTLMAPNRARTLKNYSLEAPGELVTRPGYSVVSSASLGTGRATGGQRVYLASTAFTLVGWNGAVYKPTDAFVWGASVYSSISTGNQTYFPYDRDLVAVMDGANRPRMSTDGSTWVWMGITAPSSGAALSSLSTGGLTSGEYAVVYSYKHRGTAHESNTSSESTITITATSGAITVTASPSTDAKVDAYIWYARHKLPDGESVLRKVSSGSSATIVITSSAWTSANEAPSNHNVPPTGLKFGTPWKNRWWAPDGTTGNRLWFTEIFLPQAWPTTYYIDIPFEKGDTITAIQPLGDTLLVYGQSGIFLVIGQTSLDFEVRPSQGADAGAFGARSVGRVEQAAIHASGDGVDSFDGAADRSLEHDIGPGWRDLVTHESGANLSLVATIYDALRQEFRISVPRVYPTGAAGEWVLNLDRTRENEGTPAWTTTDRDIAFYMHWNGNEPTAGNRGRLFSMPSSSGIIVEENVGASANSSNMTSEYEGPALSLGLHRGRILDVHVEYEPHAGAFSIEPVVDGVSQGAISLSIGSGLYAYGTTGSDYGTATYGGSGRKHAYSPLPLGAEGRTIVTKTSYSGQERFRHFTYAYGIQPEPSPRQMSD